MPTINVLSKNEKKYYNFHLKIVIFSAVKNRSILHGPVFVMSACRILQSPLPRQLRNNLLVLQVMKR